MEGRVCPRPGTLNQVFLTNQIDAFPVAHTLCSSFSSFFGMQILLVPISLVFLLVIKCAALNNPKGRDPSWWTSGHSAPTHTLLSLEGNVFFWNEFTPWWVDHIFWQVALLTFLECLWRIRPLVMGRSTNTALLLCLMGSILSSQSSMTSLWTFSLDTTLPCLWRRTWVQSRPWALQRWVSKQNFPQGFDNSN